MYKTKHGYHLNNKVYRARFHNFYYSVMEQDLGEGVVVMRQT